MSGRRTGSAFETERTAQQTAHRWMSGSCCRPQSAHKWVSGCCGVCCDQYDRETIATVSSRVLSPAVLRLCRRGHAGWGRRRLRLRRSQREALSVRSCGRWLSTHGERLQYYVKQQAVRSPVSRAGRPGRSRARASQPSGACLDASPGTQTQHTALVVLYELVSWL